MTAPPADTVHRCSPHVGTTLRSLQSFSCHASSHSRNTQRGGPGITYHHPFVQRRTLRHSSTWVPPPDTPLPQTWPPLPGSPLCWAGHSGHSVCPEPALPFTSPNFLPSPLSQFSVSQQEEFHEIHQKTPGAVPSTQWALQERGLPPSQIFSLHSFSSQEIG